MSLSRTVDAVGRDTGFDASGVSGRSVVGKPRVGRGAGAACGRASARRRAGIGNALVGDAAVEVGVVSQAVALGVPFVVSRSPPRASKRRVRERQLQAREVDEGLVEDAVVARARHR